MKEIITIKKDSFFMLLPEDVRAFQRYSNEAISESNKHSLSIKNSIIATCTFSKVILSNSDFESCEISNCHFLSVSLNNTDICTTIFRKCCFENVSFENATILDSMFIECSFIKCNFDHITMTNTRFENSSFFNFKIRQCSAYLNEFINTKFEKALISGNVHYNIFASCSFVNSSMGNQLFSHNYFLGESHLSAFSLNGNQVEDYKQRLINQYEFFNAAIIDFNNSSLLIENSLLNCISALGKMIELNIIVRVEQVAFLKNIYLSLIRQNLVAPIASIHIINVIDSVVIKEEINSINLKAIEQLEVFKNYCYYEFRKWLNLLSKKQKDIPIHNKDITIRIVYHTEPVLQLADLLNSAKHELGIVCCDAKRIRTEVGSFVDFISAPDKILPCLNIIISLLGLASDIFFKTLSAKSKKKKSSDTPQTIIINNNNITNNNNINNYNVLVLTGETEKQTLEVVSALNNCGVTFENNYLGFNINNVKEISFEYH